MDEIGSSLRTEARKMLMMLRRWPKSCGMRPSYGFHRLEAFPVDVWMARRYDGGLFPGESPDSFWRVCGIAQQYIYYYSRLHPELFFLARGLDSINKEDGFENS